MKTLALVLLIMTLFAGCRAEASEPIPTKNAMMELVILEPTPAEPDPVPDENEAELIEEALSCQGYFRDDIPLSYEEQDFLHAACDEFGIDYYLMVALIEHETDFRNIPGDGGASQGYCQIQQKWWGGLMEEIGAEDLTNPYDNFRTGCAILVCLLDRYDGDIEKALTAYNQGHYKGTVTKYARSILERAGEWRCSE